MGYEEIAGRADNDQKIQKEGTVLYVIDVVHELFVGLLDGCAGPEADLRPSGQPRLHDMPHVVVGERLILLC